MRKIFIAACACVVVWGLVLAPAPAGRYTVRCYEPSIPDSQLIADWSGLSHAECNRAACTMKTKYHETVYVIPQGIACAVENAP